MAFHQNNHSTQNFSSRTTGAETTKSTGDDRIKRIETDNYNLRRQLEDKTKENTVLRENYLKQQNDLADLKAKNQQLEKKSVAQKEEINRIQGLFVNACKKRDPHALNQKVEEISEKLQASEEELKCVQYENQRLKRKLSDNHDEIKKKRQKLTEKCAKIDQCQNDLEKLQEKCTQQANELVKVREALKITKETITKLESERDSQVRELTNQASLFQHALEEKQILQHSLGEAQKITQDLEQTIKICNLKTRKLKSRNHNLKTKLKRKQVELNDTGLDRNHLFKFVQDVCILIQFHLNNSSPLQNQLPELLAYLKGTLQVGSSQYHQQNQRHISASSTQPPQQPCDQLYDEFTSQSMMNISFPLPASSFHTSVVTNINFQTVQTLSKLPQQSNKAEIETSKDAGSSQDPLYEEIMSGVHQSVNLTKLKAKVNKAKKAKAPPPPRVKQTVTGISQTKKHKEDVSKRIKGRGRNCEGGAKYFCVCGRLETSLDRLKVHIEQFNQEKKFQCEKCPRRFLYVCYLRQHLTRTHQMPHALDHISMGCRSCGEMFTTHELYRQHVISVHNNSASTDPVVVAIENATDSASSETEMATAKVTAAPEDHPPQPNNGCRRVPSVYMDSEDEEVDIET